VDTELYLPSPPENATIVKFLDESELTTEIPAMLPAVLMSDPRSSKIPTKLEGKTFEVLLDTGAELSVLPKYLMDKLVNNRTAQPGQVGTRKVKTFGPDLVTLEGPRFLSVEICGTKLIHPFYTLSAETPLVVGIDLITAAKLVIDSVHRKVWTYYDLGPSIGVYASAQKPRVNWHSNHTEVPEAEPSTNAVQFNEASDNENLISEVSEDTNVFDTFGDGAPISASSDAREHLVRPCTEMSDSALVHSGLCPPYMFSAPSPTCSETTVLTAVRNDVLSRTGNELDEQLLNCTAAPGTNTTVKQSVVACDSDVSSGPDFENTDLPEHVNLLFLKTIEENDLTSDVVHDLKNLFRSHQDTFAKSSTDLGFCQLFQHDIDTGDAAPIKQSPRRPPLAACATEDAILKDMLDSGVIEPSMGFASLPREEERRNIQVLCGLPTS